MQIFHKMITAIDITSRYVSLARGRKSRGILTLIQDFYKDLKKDENPSELLKEFSHKIRPDIEDIVTVNFPNENLLFYTIDVPPGLKPKEDKEYARTEVSRLLNLPANEIVVESIRNTLNKMLIVVSRQRDINQVVSTIAQAGFLEPDVVLPDLFKYFELIDLPTTSTSVLLLFTPEYGAVVIFIAKIPVAVRTFAYSTWELMDILVEETGITQEDIHKKVDALSTSNIASLTSSLLTDLPYTVEREIIFLLNTVLPNTSIRDVSNFYVLCDPPALIEFYVRVFNQFESFQGKVQGTKFSVKCNEVGIGVLGLLVRGGAEFGKNKLVQA
ncbi:MAG TPA: hypothetical protein VIL29_08270 [Pseudothermotoga sp.]